MPTFSPCRVAPQVDAPMVRNTLHFDAWGFRSSVVESTARWSWHKRLVGVNVWIDVDGNVGEGPAPDGARVFLGGHDTDVSEADAELLRAAGWSDCIGAG